jgi:hypothetical protein
MGVVVKPKNLNDRQMKRLDKIESPERAKRVADRISDRRNARGAENPQLAKKSTMMKSGGMKKAKSGFGMLSVKAGVDNNPNPTFADKIAGAKKKAMSGMEVMKNGGKKAAKQAAIAIAMKKASKAPKKMMKNGGGILSAPKKDGLSMQLGTYKNVIGKNYTGKNVVNKGAKAKYGKSIMKSGGKCKNGC